MVKYRQKPEDFIVEEINDFEIKKSGNYKLYIVEKKSIESLFLMSYIGKMCNIPSKDVCIAGLKDKHAITKQYLTVPSQYDVSLPNEKGIKITFVGFVDNAISAGDLLGNKFIITVRDIKKGELDGIYKKAETISEIGVPNYFDSQRFGSVISKEFIVKHIMKKDYEGAVRIFLTGFTEHENKTLREEKKHIDLHWQELKKITVTSKEIANVLEEYKKTGEFSLAYRAIPSKLRELYVSAYQSFIWNECVKQQLWKIVTKKMLYSIPYSVGNLVYFKSLLPKEKELLSISFRTVAHNMEFEGYEKEIVEHALKKEGVTLDEFNLDKNSGNFFKSLQREILLFPEDFSISLPQVDELNDKGNNNIYEISVSFSLPKGSYATVIMKRLFNQ
jgi:tRNA pseudouridine13 synthase